MTPPEKRGAGVLSVAVRETQMPKLRMAEQTVNLPLHYRRGVITQKQLSGAVPGPLPPDIFLSDQFGG